MLAHENTDQLSSLETHGIVTLYIGPFLEHHRGVLAFIPNTQYFTLDILLFIRGHLQYDEGYSAYNNKTEQRNPYSTTNTNDRILHSLNKGIYSSFN
jgi:hypothetical protein